MPLEVTRMIASVGFSISGSGTSSTRTSRLPCQVTAFICLPPWCLAGRSVRARADSGLQLAHTERPARARVKWRRREALALSDALDQLAQGFGRRAARCPAELLTGATSVHQRDRKRHVEPSGGRGLQAQAP